jgi:hypothetical protein
MTWEPYIHQSRNIVAARTMVLQKETISKLECSSEHEEQKEVKKLTWDFFFSKSDLSMCGTKNQNTIEIRKIKFKKSET